MTDAYWHTAANVCTDAELEALTLRDKRHLGTRDIARILGLARSTIRDRLENADRKIAAAMNPNQETAA